MGDWHRGAYHPFRLAGKFEAILRETAVRHLLLENPEKAISYHLNHPWQCVEVHGIRFSARSRSSLLCVGKGHGRAVETLEKEWSGMGYYCHVISSI